MPAPKGSIEVLSAAPIHGVELRRGLNVTAPVPRHWHDEYQFCLIQGGGGIVNFRKCPRPTPPQSLFVIPPGEVHANECHSDQGCDDLTLFLAPFIVKEITDLGPLVTESPELVSSFIRLHERLIVGTPRLEAECLLLDFLRQMSSNHYDQEQPGDRCRPSGIARAIEYLREHFAEEVSLATLADVADLSKFHFNRSFSAATGSPPHLFQTQLRVVRAKTLLREGIAIGEVALQVGFADQSHLNRHFRRLTAVTPGQYSRHSKNDQDASAEVE
jgi:AraC-like DNA-binding protein